jgi:outer membrane protein OmpA-like peptidoglycan-associated protein
VNILRVPRVGTYQVDPDATTVTFTPSPTFTGTHQVTYRAQDVEGNVVESRLDVRVSALSVTAGTDVVYPGQTGHAALRGVPDTATVTLGPDVPGTDDVTYSDGQVHAVSAADFTGHIRVPVTVTNGTATIHLTAVITVRPKPVTGVRFHVIDGGDTLVTWNASAGPPPRAYLIRVRGHQACRTAARTCTATGVVAGPRNAVTVTAIGGDQVSSPVARGRYHAEGCAAIGAVYFSSGSAELTSVTKRELKRLAGIIGPRGFTRACLVGHTDNSAGIDYNLALSQRRVSAVAAYLHSRARRVRYATSHVGEDDPARSNRTTPGKAANRRVEIGVS